MNGMSEKEKIREELKEIAPQLPLDAPATPYSVPDGYFKQFSEKIIEATQKSPDKKVFFMPGGPWKQFAAAAILAGVLLSAFYLYVQTTNPDINANPKGWVKKEINSVSDEKLNSFVNLTSNSDSLDENSTDLASHQQEIASLTNDISDEEIHALLSEINQTTGNESSNE